MINFQLTVVPSERNMFKVTSLEAYYANTASMVRLSPQVLRVGLPTDDNLIYVTKKFPVIKDPKRVLHR